MRIFVSHSGRDKALVRDLRNHLPPWIKTWIDEERLLFGSELSPSLKDAIDSEVDYVVLLFGRDAADSPWVRQEIGWALQREEQLERAFLLPILLEPVRERLAEFGLAGRLTLELTDFTADGTRLLAEKLINHLGAWMSDQLTRLAPLRPTSGADDSLHRLSESVVRMADEIPSPWRPAVESVLVRPFVHDLAMSRIGTIPLSPAQYYKLILTEISGADSGVEIFAVSTLASDLWTHDADQTRYAVRNLEAAGRGAVIRRIFILPETRALSIAGSLQRQEEAGISVRVATTSVLAHVSDLEDFVLFDGEDGARAYTAQTSLDGSRRVRSGSLLLSDLALTRLRTAFHDAWPLATTPSRFFESRRGSASPTPARAAPGKEFDSFHLAAPVVTCEDAASARNIPLAQELKTLLLQTRHGFVAAHLPGDGVLSLRKVKARLETPEAYLADPEDLLALGLSPGTVSAVLDPVWSLPHLISRRLFTMSTVMTNNGTRTGYFEFSPAVLTEAADVIVDDFEK